jgi:phosphohistidine swiveling domain-containing protein
VRKPWVRAAPAAYADLVPSPPDVPAADRYFADVTTATGAAPAADVALGGKARSLLRLRAAGLRTPPAFVVTDGLFRALIGDHVDVDEALMTAAFPAGFLAALDQRLTALGGARFSVRSSFALEDEPGLIAAGIYESRIDVASADVPSAMREVLRSAVAPAARAYAEAHGQALAAPPLAVLIHAFVAGDAQGGAACWADPGSFLLDVHAGTPSAAARASIESAARGLFGRHGPVEIEWVAAGDIVTFVQLRPFSPPAPAATWSGWRTLSAGAEAPPGATWTWDAAHNPLPLSAAQAGLVQLVDERCRIGIRQRVIGGYLFWAADEACAAADRITPAQLTSAVRAIGDAIEAGRAALGDPPPLEAALEFFVRHYQALLGPLPPAMRAARADLREVLATHLPGEQAALPRLLAGVSSKATIRRDAAADLARATSASERSRALAAYLALFGDEAAAWDVAAPTLREQPEMVVVNNVSAPPPAPDASAWSTEAARLGAQLPVELAACWSQLVTDARAAVAAGEDDDWLYARIQAPVRQALLALGRGLVAAGQLGHADDVFDLPLDVARAIARGATFAPGVLQAQADQGRHAQSIARHDPPPLAPARAGSEAGRDDRQVRGHGCGGHAIGQVVLRHGPRGSAPPPDAILLATSLLPTELPLLQVAALVTETGGPLGHVATQARERGLPAVVGAAGALALFRDGDLAIVDGVDGVVRRA